jgi:uncharacterized protein YbaR (Trm112 family)
MKATNIKNLLNILACPNCTSLFCLISEQQHSSISTIPSFKLEHLEGSNELACFNCNLAFPVVENIPIMLTEEARKIK